MFGLWWTEGPGIETPKPGFHKQLTDQLIIQLFSLTLLEKAQHGLNVTLLMTGTYNLTLLVIEVLSLPMCFSLSKVKDQLFFTLPALCWSITVSCRVKFSLCSNTGVLTRKN